MTQIFYCFDNVFVSEIICIMSYDRFTIRVHGFGVNLHNYSMILPYSWLNVRLVY